MWIAERVTAVVELNMGLGGEVVVAVVPVADGGDAVAGRAVVVVVVVVVVGTVGAVE